MHTLQLGLTWLSWQLSKLGYSFYHGRNWSREKEKEKLKFQSNSFSSHSPSSSSLHCMAAQQLSQIHQKLKVTIYSRVYVNVNISKLCWYEEHVNEVWKYICTKCHLYLLLYREAIFWACDVQFLLQKFKTYFGDIVGNYVEYLL